MVLSPGKCHCLVLRNRSNSDTINLNGTKLASSSYEKLLGILTDRDLSFDNHIKSLYKRAGQKLNALARTSNYLTRDQKRLFSNSIIKSQLSYCPLIWMFCSCSLNNLFNQINDLALRLIHNDHVSTFQDMNGLNGLTPSIMNGAFMIRNDNYNVRNFQCLYSTNKGTVKYETETVTYRGSQIWNLVPERKLKIRLLLTFLKKKLENGRVKSVHVEYVKRTFNM